MGTQTTTVLLASQVSDSGLGPRSGSFNSDITPEYWKDPLLGITMYSWQWITFAVLLVYCCCCCCVGICGGLYAYQKKRKKRNMAFNAGDQGFMPDYYQQDPYANPGYFQTSAVVLPGV